MTPDERNKDRPGISRVATVAALVVVIAVAGAGGYLFLVPGTHAVSTSSTTASSSSGGIVMSTEPATPLVAPGQTQNYTLLKVESGSASPSAVTLSVGAPFGLSFELNQTSVSVSSTPTLIPVVLKAPSDFAPGNYSVTVTESSTNGPTTAQDIRVDVVPMLITMQDIAFHPDNVTVPVGTKVTWINLDGMIGCCDPGNHDVSFVTMVNMTSPVMARLQTWSFTPTVPGVYLYYCTIHPWMTASLTVTNSTATAT